MSEQEEWAYIGVGENGRIVACCVDNPDHKGDIAKDLADWVKDGLTIHRMRVTEVREKIGKRIGAGERGGRG